VACKVGAIPGMSDFAEMKGRDMGVDRFAQIFDAA
jgi:hypothetical protein